MAAILEPALEAIATRVLTALGVGVVAGEAGKAAKEQAQKRQQESDDARSSPVARTEATTKKRKKCEECPPDGGTPFQRNFKERKPWVDYQARITGMASGPTFIMEWDFAGTKFDGFVSAQCLLQDAKAGYDKFFNIWDAFDYPFQKIVFEKMTDDAVVQNNKAVPKPPVQLRWYFQEPVSYRYMQNILKFATPEIEVIFQP